MPESVPEEKKGKQSSVVEEIEAAIQFIIEMGKLEKELAIWRTIALSLLIAVIGFVSLFTYMVWKAFQV